jgi:hypothetical protein
MVFRESQFGQTLKGLRLDNGDLFYGRLEYFTDIWDILRTFGVRVVHFFPVFVSWAKKNLAALESMRSDDKRSLVAAFISHKLRPKSTIRDVRKCGNAPFTLLLCPKIVTLMHILF